MANRYANLEGSKKISEDFGNINIGFDRVQAEMDTKGTPADAQAKADAAKTAAIAAAAADLAAHKARGADEHPTAKGNAAGFMSAADKLKSDASTSAATPDTLMQRDAEGRAKVTAPLAADDIARKAETDAVQSNLDSHTGDTVKHVTQAEHDKLNGIAAGAEVNQNAFSKINDVSAGSKTDTVTLVGGTGITITTDPANKRVSFTATGEATPGPHALSHIQGGTDVIPDAETGGVSGLMSGADAKFVRQDGETKTGAQAKADAAEQAANEYTDQKVGEIVIDDASLTTKGIVQLSNVIDGDAENVAATEKAVNDARKAAIRDAGLEVDKTYIRKNRPSNLLPNSSAEMQIQGWTNVSSVPFVSSNDVNDEVSTAFVSNGATTSASSILKSDNISIRSGVTYTLSADFINPGGIAGQIIVSLRNASGGSLVESISCDAGTSWHRKAITFALGLGTYYVELSIPLGLSGVNRRVRRIMFSTGTDGDLWNQDSNDRLLFQSVSDGKTAIAAAITGKGVAASGSDTFPQLATKIGQIETGIKFASGTTTSMGTKVFLFSSGTSINYYYIKVSNLGFKPSTIVLYMNERKITCVGRNQDYLINGLPVYWGYGDSGATEGGYQFRLESQSVNRTFIDEGVFQVPIPFLRQNSNPMNQVIYWEAYG
ncbi:phage tail protein [Paenibacillus sp. DR312]|uniref:phage tail protein n=1 Tax=unclassified Paenibacillus TaxID=185978 RepID=UPI001C971E54|nr:phage tail protein [Paenibacillus sp. DR312]QZN77385.1 phage tail protein [Paenibacillus sp. DR312]